MPRVKHHCHAEGCGEDVPPAMLMCRRHWYMVRKDFRDLVWAYYRNKQEVTKTPTAGYLLAMTLAVCDVAQKEGRLSAEEIAERVERCLKLCRRVGENYVIDLIRVAAKFAQIREEAADAPAAQ